MITVKCGYEGCDWKLQISEDVLYSMYTVKMEEKDRDYPLLYIDHVIKVHGIPPAIWER